MDMAADVDDFKISSNGARKSYDIEYQPLSQNDVERLMQQDVDHITGIFGVDVRTTHAFRDRVLFLWIHQANTASLLLRHMNWNKERLIEKYMDNSSAVTVAAGITPPPPEPAPINTTPIRSQGIGAAAASATSRLGIRRPSRKDSGSSKSSKPTGKRTADVLAQPAKPAAFVCPICFDDTQTATLSLSCEHPFCIACWHAYLASKIRDEGEHTIYCMAQDCKVIVPDTTAKKVLLDADDSAVWERFQELLVRHFVASNPNLKYCPYPACTFTVSCPAAAGKSVLATVVPTVTCGATGPTLHRFCFGCSIDTDHRPVVCNVAKMWLKKCRDDSETANWIKSNTKECSQCQSTIEKNGGCK
jgi:ariadne-1